MKEDRSSDPFPRRKTRRILVGDVSIGNGSPISVQSMTNTDTRDIQATLSQIKSLEAEGCQIVRLAVIDREAAEAIKILRKETSVPLIADIHFDHRLALASLDAGVDALRINPGTIGSRKKVREIVKEAKNRAAPIRIGVNSGSVEKRLITKYGGPTPQAMVESVLGHVRLLEDMDFFRIKISLKASDVLRTLESYRMLAGKVDYPFHTGITEAGGRLKGTVKSSAGLALLIREGLADTIRVSLTAPPEEEVRVAFALLSSLGIRNDRPNLISCPTCGRCQVDLLRISEEVERRLFSVKGNVTVAVMGCAVNGPGEAREADIGVACGRGSGLIFKKGRVIGRVKEEDIVRVLVHEVLVLTGQEKGNR
ncbi:MAG: flavodoxin-dependent (E)-4-hydroxy-3-methylbut-2-enyl-diphosphate synthase [Candidatus Aminicenantes bacterium]|nr:flavodoxin-dependent (E)-4-hydroxy-3-methylbut-2-enyl-diphosphate synthase [Candidatus Aminicenantes bacterium]